MASFSKPTPRQTFTKIKSPHLLESSFDIMDKSVSRPNSSMATPTYMSTVQYKSTQSTLKRTRSNSSIPTEGPRPVNTSEKSTGSPVNFQLSVHGISPKGMSDLSATTSLQLDKGTSDDSYLRNKNKNSTGNRMLSSNGWTGQKKFKASHQLLEHSQSEFQRHKSPMHSRESKRNDSVSKRDMGDQNKSQVKELILGYSKSVSYGIAESETPGSTQRTVGLTKRNKFQTPVCVIDCDLDLKENKEGLQENMNRNNIETPHIQSPYTIMPLEKSNQNTLAKKAARGSSVKRSNQGLDQKKTEKRGKENELVDESQLRERGTNNKESNRNSSFFNKKTDLRPPSRPSTTKASLSTRREEPVNFSELSTRQLETPTDLEASARILQKIRPPMMLHAHSATVTPKNYFVPKTTSSVSQSQRNSSPRSSKTPRTTFSQLQTQPANAEVLTSVQPSKNSEFSFKMTYFKPIEDSKLDEFISNVNNDSYFPKKDLNKTSEKNRHVTEPMEPSFSTPLPSTGATSKARSRYSGDNSKDEGLNSTGEVTIPETKVLGSSKKSLTIDSKNTSTLMEKTMVQDMHGKPPKPRSNNSTIKLKEERQTTTECVPERAVSPSFENKKNMMSAEKPKVKDMSSTTKIESKARTTYSKLDKLLQEIKSNPGNKQNDEEGKPDSSELEKELFGQSSKGISSSSSTNCSISKSYAHTLMKVTSV